MTLGRPTFDWATVCGARAAVMGIVNVTPDSFSDGGRYLDPEAGYAHGMELVGAGADLLDVGGESTRPGASPVGADEERRRVVPVIERLARRAGVPISVDTAKASVAAAALDAGAAVVNDVTAGSDPEMLALVAQRGAGFVAMHMLGEPRTMQADPRYDDVVREVGEFLDARLDAARDAGVAPAALVADPGLGFGKTVAHNLALLAGLRRLGERLGVPLLVGPSRKAFLGAVLRGVGGPAGVPAPAERGDGTLAACVWALDEGAKILRVHEPAPIVRARRLLDVIEGARP